MTGLKTKYLFHLGMVLVTKYLLCIFYIFLYFLTGYYCPYGTGENLQMCPAGTYNPIENLATELQCTQCDPGTYCQLPGQSNYTGLCTEGYFCTLGKP